MKPPRLAGARRTGDTIVWTVALPDGTAYVTTLRDLIIDLHSEITVSASGRQECRVGTTGTEYMDHRVRRLVHGALVWHRVHRGLADAA